jgi:hypothetical protein
MNALRNCQGAIRASLAARIRIRMTRLNPLNARGQIDVLVGANCNCVTNREMRRRGECRSHRRGCFACRHNVQRAAGDDAGDLRIAKRACNDVARADRVNAGADYFEKILSESGNGNRQ